MGHGRTDEFRKDAVRIALTSGLTHPQVPQRWKSTLLKPLNALIDSHVFVVTRLHGDDTTVQRLARGRTKTARLWTYSRDGRHFSGHGGMDGHIAATCLKNDKRLTVPTP